MKLLPSTDLQVNGGWGIDLLQNQDEEALFRLAYHLSRSGTEGFLPTLITAPWAQLQVRLQALGRWIRSAGDPSFTASRASNAWRSSGFAAPLGIHLEGPFLSPEAAGVHPRSSLRVATLKDLNTLWKASQGTLKLLTLAPEVHSSKFLKELSSWANDREIRLSIGHSRATEAEAKRAFDLGMTSVTHAWNAGAFHHREPGILGAALGDPRVWVQLIPDGLHVSDTVLRWVHAIHPSNRLIWVSDLAPVGGMRSGGRATFGPLEVRQARGRAETLQDGALCGGAAPLSELAWKWCERGSLKASQAQLRGWVDRNAREFLGLSAKK